MSYGQVLHRRLLKLERTVRPSTANKLEAIQQATLAATSMTDFHLIKEHEALTLAGREEDATDEQRLAQERFDRAYENALVEVGPSFTIAEMDQILGAE